MLKAAASHDAWAPAVIAVVLALAAAALLPLAALPHVELDAAVVLLWVAGWACVVWSALSAALALAILWRSRGSVVGRMTPSALAVGLAAATLAATIAAHPPFGSGGA